MKTSLVFTAVTGLASLASAGLLQPRQNETMEYGFENLKPSKDIVWTPCFDNFTCALLEVPLDYTNASAGITTLAFTKYWSNHSDAEDVLINPGGPGDSGVQEILNGYENLQDRIGPQYNLVGFDPRGVNNSGPNVTCFPGDPRARNNFDTQFFAPVDNSTEYGLADAYQRTGAFGEWCTSVHAINGTASYVGTVAVAQDMLHYVELLAESKGCQKDDAKIYYYGTSYGTVLGATFATLYPDRLGRFVLDGNVDTENYYLSGSENGLYATNDAARSFFTYCFAAGDRCAFRQNSSSADELQQRYLAITNTLKESPIAVASIENQFYPALVTWQDLIGQFLSKLYQPLAMFPILDLMLTQLEVGNATLLAAASGKGTETVPAPVYISAETQRIVSCIDQAGRYNLSDFDKFKEHVEFVNDRSPVGGPNFPLAFGGPCRSYKIFPPENQIFPGIPGANKTSAPILFISNTRDPVTPLRNGHLLNGLFAGSGLLTLNATGHCSLAQVSDCTAQYTRAYMANATLPPPGTVCEIDVIPFQQSTASKK
ncbi:Alpha/Beta hydrolase protein [Lophiotrema nucula]|uniref:Alpha/Beta hydrolase protein n=1 Tax=Lophiotrema nucula TaxID=690887 RepID=A0A6A5ZQ69_9PLEO|nr:Alpha/Beta hydrolase protein [Lophiotrema nucula]